MATIWLSGFHGLAYGDGPTALNARHRCFTAGSLEIQNDIRREIDWGIVIEADDAYCEFGPELEGSYATLTVGFYLGLWYVEEADALGICYFYDETENATHVSLLYDLANERLVVVRGSSLADTVLWAGSNGSFPLDGEGHYFEVQVVFHNSTGSVVVKLDGTTTLCSLTGQDTINGSFTGVNFVGPWINSSAGNGYAIMGLCAMYVRDDTTFLGAGRVRVVEVDDDHSVDFTPLASTNVSQVDDGTEESDDDASYNHSATVNDEDMFTVGSARPATADIKAVQAVVRARATADDGRELAAQIDIGAGTVVGPSKGLDTDWRGCHAITAPGSAYGSVAAAAAALDASKVGYKVTA